MSLQEGFDSIYQANKWHVNGLDRYDTIRHFLPEMGSDQTAIEVGSARGELSGYLLKHFKSLICCEISKIAIEVARKNLSKINDIELKYEDFLESKLPIVDYVIGLDVFYYFNMEKLMAKLEQVTHPGSQVIIIETLHTPTPLRTNDYRDPRDFEGTGYQRRKLFELWTWRRI